MEQDRIDKRAVAPAQRPGDEMLPHVARFQAKGYTAAKIEAWLASYGLSNVDVPALMAKAADLSPEELRVKTAESRRITRFNAPFMALGSIVVTFLISWLIVGILAATTLGELILGGSVAAGLKMGDAIWGMVSGSKPVPVFVGSVLGFAAFLGSYIFIFEVISLGALAMALLIAAITALCTAGMQQIREYERQKGKDGATRSTKIALLLVGAGLVYLVALVFA